TASASRSPPAPTGPGPVAASVSTYPGVAKRLHAQIELVLPLKPGSGSFVRASDIVLELLGQRRWWVTERSWRRTRNRSSRLRVAEGRISPKLGVCTSWMHPHVLGRWGVTR